MKILFLHGWRSTPDGLKPAFLRVHGHEVVAPALPDDDFDAAVRIAQAAFDQQPFDAVVGSSRGGAVAMNIHSGSAALVLLCPAWKQWGTARTAKPGTRILHSRTDETIPFADSEELRRASGLDESALIPVGIDHRLADLASLNTLLATVGGPCAGDWHARLGKRAPVREAGVPRRFGMGGVLLIMTMYAVLFAGMQLCRFPPVVFGIVALFCTAVGLGQMLLFRGKHPRRASVLAGAGFWPLLVIAHAVYRGPPPRSFEELCAGLLWVVLLGSLAGYFAGVLISSVFLMADQWKARGARLGANGQDAADTGQDRASR